MGSREILEIILGLLMMLIFIVLLVALIIALYIDNKITSRLKQSYNHDEYKKIKQIKKTEHIISDCINNPDKIRKLTNKDAQRIEDYIYYAAYDLFLTDAYIESIAMILIKSGKTSNAALIKLYNSFPSYRVRGAILKSSQLSTEEKTLLALKS